MLIVGEKFCRYNKYILCSAVGKDIVKARGGWLWLRRVVFGCQIEQGGLEFYLDCQLVWIKKDLGDL